jgi:hypothetical protein
VSEIWWAQLETEHFTFDAFGKSRVQAEAALTRGLQRHASQFELSPTWWHEYRESIKVVVADAPGCMRDRIDRLYF